MDIKKAYDSYNVARYEEYYKAWNWKLHDVFDKTIRPDDKVMIRDEAYINGKYIPAVLQDMEINRIAYPLEQDIVNKHTTFCVGKEPKLNVSDTLSPVEQKMYEKILDVLHDNKGKYHNKRVVRSWLSEAMVSEYWWLDKTTNSLKVELWSPFRGDRLVPSHDVTGKLVAFYRFFENKDDKGNDQKWCMYIDSTNVITYRLEGKEWVIKDAFAHGFNKLPTIYMDRDAPLCDKIKPIRNRIENIWSNSADCNDYHYAPKQIVSGEIEVKNSNPKGRNKTIKLENGADMKYLTWQQSPEMVSTEFKMLEDAAYSITNTPRMSPKEIATSGAISGEAFKYVFACIGMAVQDHEEEIGEFMQRRINFLKHAITKIEPDLKEAENMRITPELVPYSVEEPNEEKDSKSTDE